MAAIAPMTFVKLVERLRSECGVSGSPLLTAQNLSGELLRLANWIADTWNEIQTSREDWKFMRTNFTFNTGSAQSYTPAQANATNFADWKQDSLWIYNTALGVGDQVPLPQMDWDWFREMYIRGPQNPQRPMTYSIDPQMNLWFGPPPDNPTTYNLTGEYWTQPVVLAGDTDAPSMPARFHMLIVYEAMKKYAGFEAASEVYQRGVSEGSRLWANLEKDQLPPVRVQGGFDGALWD